MSDDDFDWAELHGHDEDYREEKREAKRRRMRRWKEGDNPLFSSYDEDDEQ